MTYHPRVSDLCKGYGDCKIKLAIALFVPFDAAKDYYFARVPAPLRSLGASSTGGDDAEVL